jgi:hypothetical protein
MILVGAVPDNVLVETHRASHFAGQSLTGLRLPGGRDKAFRSRAT